MSVQRMQEPADWQAAWAALDRVEAYLHRHRLEAPFGPAIDALMDLRRALMGILTTPPPPPAS